MTNRGGVKQGINYKLLRQILDPEISDTDEAYTFDWVGKKASIVEANAPIHKTLRPVPEKSKNWDSTENIYIEGDNLEALKLLQESYLGKVKMIYIDPPYNTGNDFIYRDDFAMKQSDFDEGQGVFDKETGNRLFRNTDSNGRFHSDWCSVLYSRLLLARNLLADNGVLIVSISDAEVQNLRKMLDELFGADNYLGDILWNSTKSVTNTALLSVSHTYNLVYVKDMNYFVTHRSEFRLPDEGTGFENPDHDPRGPWKADPFQVGGWRPNQQYEITNPNTGVKYRPNPGNSWKNDYDHYLELVKDNRIVFGKNGEAGPQRKRFLWEAKERGKVAKTWWDDVETTTNGTQQIKKLFNGKTVFTNPKPVGLLLRLIQLASNVDGVILDFFSGSATTAHAVMQQNVSDGGHRKFILVQLPEKCDENSEAYKAGYKFITDIGEERIRRAGARIEEEAAKKGAKAPDTGFRVFKVDDSNMKPVYYAADDYSQAMLDGLESNIKEDRTDLDLLFGCLVDWGLPLSKQYKSEEIDGVTVHDYDNGVLVACFAENVPETVIKAIARKQPLRVVFRDSCFQDSAAKINLAEIFKMLSPDTTIKVL